MATSKNNSPNASAGVGNQLDDKMNDERTARDEKQAGATEVKTVYVNTGDSQSRVYDRAMSYGLQIGLDQHGQAYEVTFPNGAKVKADE